MGRGEGLMGLFPWGKSKRSGRKRGGEDGEGGDRMVAKVATGMKNTEDWKWSSRRYRGEDDQGYGDGNTRLW